MQHDYSDAVDCLATMRTAENYVNDTGGSVAAFQAGAERYEELLQDLGRKLDKSSIDADISGARIKGMVATGNMISAAPAQSNEAVDRMKRDITICAGRLDAFESKYARVGG